MKRCIFEGAATALVTPMCEDGSVNYACMKELIEKQINAGIDALIICGTTGESATLNHEEHVKVLSEAVKAANGRVPIISGTGSNDTQYCVTLSREAVAVGCDALLMVTPYYNKASQSGLVAHYNYIADRVDAPIILYNVPSRTGTKIMPETYAELSKHPNIVAAKEASGDFTSIVDTIALCGDELTMYSGNDDQIIPLMSLGGKGVISVLSNIFPAETHAMCKKFLDGDVKAAAADQIKYAKLISALFSDVNPIPVKEAMNIMGINVGPCRLPLSPMSKGAREKLVATLKEYGCI